MKDSIVYSSRSGNTALLAKKIAGMLPGAGCIRLGPPDKKTLEADRIFAGFWTNKGSCDEEMSAFLECMKDKQVFLFGTAGFGGSQDYFDTILSRVRERLDPSNTILGSYMCQGRMPLAVRQRYESMLPTDPVKMQLLIDNFDLALSHPDASDLDRLEKAIRECTLS